MTLLSRLPIMPLYYGGKTKFAPIHVLDLVDILYDLIDGENRNMILECVGPEELSFKEIISKLLFSIKKKINDSFSNALVKFSAKVLQLFPKPLLTEDQLKLLKYDNVKLGKYKTNFDIGFKTNRLFSDEIEKYSFNWRDGGQYTK